MHIAQSQEEAQQVSRIRYNDAFPKVVLAEGFKKKSPFALVGCVQKVDEVPGLVKLAVAKEASCIALVLPECPTEEAIKLEDWSHGLKVLTWDGAGADLLGSSCLLVMQKGSQHRDSLQKKLASAVGAWKIPPSGLDPSNVRSTMEPVSERELATRRRRMCRQDVASETQQASRPHVASTARVS